MRAPGDVGSTPAATSPAGGRPAPDDECTTPPGLVPLNLAAGGAAFSGSMYLHAPLKPASQPLIASPRTPPLQHVAVAALTQPPPLVKAVATPATPEPAAMRSLARELHNIIGELGLAIFDAHKASGLRDFKPTALELADRFGSKSRAAQLTSHGRPVEMLVTEWTLALDFRLHGDRALRGVLVGVDSREPAAPIDVPIADILKAAAHPATGRLHRWDALRCILCSRLGHAASPGFSIADVVQRMREKLEGPKRWRVNAKALHGLRAMLILCVQDAAHLGRAI